MSTVAELETEVTLYLDMMAANGTTEISAKQVMVEALHFEPDKPDFAERAGRVGLQVANAIQRAGWVKIGTMGRGKARRTMYRLVHRGAQG